MIRIATETKRMSQAISIKKTLILQNGQAPCDLDIERKLGLYAYSNDGDVNTNDLHLKYFKNG